MEGTCSQQLGCRSFSLLFLRGVYLPDQVLSYSLAIKAGVDKASDARVVTNLEVFDIFANL